MYKISSLITENKQSNEWARISDELLKTWIDMIVGIGRSLILLIAEPMINKKVIRSLISAPDWSKSYRNNVP